MAKGTKVRLDDRSRWFLRELAGLVVGGDRATVESLNRAALRVTGGWLRVLGHLDPYPEPPEARALEVAPEGSVSPADAESIRLGDAERAFLDKLKGLLEPGEDTTLAGLNRRALGLAEENLRVLGFLETYIPPSASKALRKQQPTPKEAKLGR